MAIVNLELAEGAPGGVVWEESLASSERTYGEAVAAGIQDALGWHTETGGAPVAFLVRDLQELSTDTTPGNVRCAAAGAAWVLLGHRREELVFELDPVTWVWKIFCIP